MKYSQAYPGRIFILRLEDGEILHETIEAFAREHSITAAAVIAVGGADEGSKLIVGKPVLHMHIAGGRKDRAVTGCVRRGVKVWQVLEVIIAELVDPRAHRAFDENTGLEMLEL
jgi:predicted DNA-binding protein with PD1-like motif